jgi:hypothetical protein
MLSQKGQSTGQDSIRRSWRTLLSGRNCLIMATALAVAVFGVGVSSAQSGDGPIVGAKVTPKLSIPARDLPAAPPPSSNEVNPLQDSGAPPSHRGPKGIADPAAQFSAGEGFELELLGDPIVNVLGMGGRNPNDTNGDVGPTISCR